MASESDDTESGDYKLEPGVLYLKKLPSGKYAFARSTKRKKWFLDFVFVDEPKKKKEDKKSKEDEKPQIVTGPSYWHYPWNWQYGNWQNPYWSFPNWQTPNWQYPYPSWQYPGGYPQQSMRNASDLGSGAVPAVGQLAPAPPPPPYNPPDIGTCWPENSQDNRGDDPLTLASMVAQPGSTVRQQQDAPVPTDRHGPVLARPPSPPANNPPANHPSPNHPPATHPPATHPPANHPSAGHPPVTPTIPNAPVLGTAPKPPQPEAKHTCNFCGRVRSPAYHAKHPIRPGHPPSADVCRKCQNQDTSSDEAADGGNDKTRRHITRKERPRRRPDRRDRQVVRSDVATIFDSSEQSDHGAERTGRRRRGSVHRNRRDDRRHRSSSPRRRTHSHAHRREPVRDGPPFRYDSFLEKRDGFPVLWHRYRPQRTRSSGRKKTRSFLDKPRRVLAEEYGSSADQSLVDTEWQDNASFHRERPPLQHRKEAFSPWDRVDTQEPMYGAWKPTRDRKSRQVRGKQASASVTAETGNFARMPWSDQLTWDASPQLDRHSHRTSGRRECASQGRHNFRGYQPDKKQRGLRREGYPLGKRVKILDPGYYYYTRG